MQRYSLNVEHPEHEAMDTDSDGEWVRFADLPEVGKSGLAAGYVPCGFLVKPATRFHQYFEREDSAKDYAQAYNYDTGEEVTITPIFKEGT